jgi:UDP-N-acetylmuramoylalanine--D-glutamate ligase
MIVNIFNTLKKKYQGKKVLVVGLGLQGGGVGIAKFFSELEAKVTVTDKKDENKLFQSIDRLKHLPIMFHLGGHKVEDFLNADVIFMGPSVPWTTDAVVQAQKKGIPVEMEMSFIAANYPGKMIGITGTRGKSTTTHLIYNLLMESGFKVNLGGGLPGISSIEYLKNADEDSWLVAELSSWALSGFHRRKISPNIAVFTNFYPDHLNYYKNLEDYFYDKQAIYQYQKESDYFIANLSLKNLIEKTRYQFFNGKPQTVKKLIPSFFRVQDFPDQLIYLKGDHNLENAAATLKVAEILKIDKNKAIEIIKNFQGLPFRLQIIGKKDNVTFINDTTSTTPIATIKAIESLKNKKIILFLGGNSKNLPNDVLINQLIDTEKIVLLSGSFTDEILPILKEKYFDKLTGPFDNLDQAVKQGYELTKNINEECYLLFSPGATSFAMFNNEFHRGEEFNRIVKKILNL